MEEKYKRGDMVDKQIDEKLTPKELISRGNASEEMIKGDGWKYLKDWINRKIALDTELICGFNSNENETMDLKVDRLLCKAILRKPIEFMEQRNKLQK